MDIAGTYRELEQKFGLERETIGGGAQMLSRYLENGASVYVTCEGGGGLPTSENWHVCAQPPEWDGDGGALLFEAGSERGGAPDFLTALNAALFAAEYGRRSIGELTIELAEWCKREAVPHVCAEELMHENLSDAQRAYVSAFVVRWQLAEQDDLEADDAPCPINRRPKDTCPPACDHGETRGEYFPGGVLSKD